ncbi:MAG: hypothetical protein A3K19_14400 [Lentisphaerae bacterium RIFOXYB12_FULL_65_16]|nr:MAG: hypothetical protein A3K18_18445 [Lentisphaerae bacterium RIFOXYA12_64_32]OGV87414.1 MAG: hypothetical protein A3K19_14400 [Lentisphaerae bacterium RIFOXYB12_FULL_65_16]
MLHIERSVLAIPTYLRGPDDPYPPLTFSGRGPVHLKPFPYPVQDDIDLATMPRDAERPHRVIRLSNGLLEALVLPDMNGRLYSLRDLRNDREIFYRNRVVKPGLVALRGAWLSGGVEFNFPTLGHTVSTASPVFSRIERRDDEVAVVVGDIDRTTRQVWEVRMALRPNRAALDIETTFTNPNPYRERLYYWENAAVPATDDLRFICRCDWTLGTPPQPFPIREGKDVSAHVNNPTPHDHFGYRSHADFFGAYYATRRLGTYHVAPRIRAPGQKYFTWGVKEDSNIWLRYLTDADGQYVEIQAGVLESQLLTDWLAPLERLTTAGCWFGTQDMAELTWANASVAVAVVTEQGRGSLEVFSVDVEGDCDAVFRRGAAAHTVPVRLSPGIVHRIPADTATPFCLELRRRSGRLVLAGEWYGAEHRGMDPARLHDVAPQPWSALSQTTPAVRKAEHAEKYHRWAEMERLLSENGVKDTLEAGVPSALLALKTGDLAAAWDRAQQGLARDPVNASLHAVAAVVAVRQLRLTGDRAWYYRVWDHALAARRDRRSRPVSLRTLAEAAILDHRFLEARDALELLVADSAHSAADRALLAAVCRWCGDPEGAAQQWPQVARLAGLGGVFERFLAGGTKPERPELPGEDGLSAANPTPNAERRTSNVEGRNAGDVSTVAAAWLPVQHAELVLEHLMLYWRVGLLEDLARLLDLCAEWWPCVAAHPVSALLRSDLAAAKGSGTVARQWASTAADSSIEWVFPSRWEDAALLQRALTRAGATSAPTLRYLLALYQAENNQVAAARESLEAGLTSNRAEVVRLAGKALADWAAAVQGDKELAARHLEAVLTLGGPDRRLVLRLDDCLRDRQDITRRKKLWAGIPRDWQARGDVTFRLAQLDFDEGRAGAAIARLVPAQFSVFEGGSAIRRLYVDALLVDAIGACLAGDAARVESRCKAVFEFPENLGAASWLGEHSRFARFLLGLFAWRKGRQDEGRQWWEDVLARSGVSKAYAVGEEQKTVGLRADEALAVFLAARRLNGQGPAERARPPTSSENVDERTAEIADGIRAGAPDVLGEAERALARFPCAALLRILTGLARFRPWA